MRLCFSLTGKRRPKTLCQCGGTNTSSVGNIVAPQFFITAEAPGYRTGYRAILGTLSIAIVALLVYAAGVHYENKRTLRELDGQEPGVEVVVDDALADLTDKEKKDFVYVY